VGLGKTHLLHAIGHMAQVNHIQVLYVSSERFTNEFITAVRERKTEEFRNKYRSVDMLLIDDIQFISGKEQTEESFFHTFDELYNANRQIVLTSNCPPKAMSLLQDRLCSRFEWGLIADIQPPDFETRLAILRVKAKQQGVRIPADVLEFIGHRVQQNTRELEGSLNRVIAYAKLIRALPTPEIAAQALEDITSKQPKTASITPGLIIEAVAISFQLTPIDLKSRKKDKETALARQVAMYLMRQETNCSLSHIGQALGGKNPSTISHACEKIASDIDASTYLRRKIFDIREQIYPKQKGRNH
jgi:chromosomal replication initiator protein